MLKKTDNTDAAFRQEKTLVEGMLPFRHPIVCPGLTPAAHNLYEIAEDLPKRLAVFKYKLAMPCLWVVFLGGTGTGKSTLFNAFCGAPLSDTGVERPKTSGPIVYVHKDCDLENSFPFPSLQIIRKKTSLSLQDGPNAGKPGHILFIEHDQDRFAHLVVVDTPDLDSIDFENRRLAGDMVLLSDVIIFVSSQEKYADEIPYKLLQKISLEQKPCFVLINKAGNDLTKDDVMATLGQKAVPPEKEFIWTIPYAAALPSQWISENPSFRDFSLRLFKQFSPEKAETCLDANLLERRHDLIDRLSRLLEHAKEEVQSGRKWVDKLDALYEKECLDLIADQQKRFTAENRDRLQAEIKKIFTRYDLLAKPRKIIKQILFTPLILMGLGKRGQNKSHKESLLTARKKSDPVPVHMAVLRFNRSVLDQLSPSDKNALLFAKLRESGVELQEEEINRHIQEEQEQIAAWLEETFHKLSQGIPKSKEWGIYSTSLLWGILILSFETVVGGGFTVLDAALDTFLGPFVTKGATGLFAYQEIQKITRELAALYQDGLRSVIRAQRDQYERCLNSLIPPVQEIEKLRDSIQEKIPK